MRARRYTKKPYIDGEYTSTETCIAVNADKPTILAQQRTHTWKETYKRAIYRWEIHYSTNLYRHRRSKTDDICPAQRLPPLQHSTPPVHMYVERSQKEPCTCSKEPCTTSKEPCTFSKEPCMFCKESCTFSKEPCTFPKSPARSRKSSARSQKNPARSQKSHHTFSEELYTIPKETYIQQ